jgi:isopenicillin-N N-acyltransferase-like protein
MASYLQLELVGDGRARGTAYGRAARQDILANMATYEERLTRSGLAWRDARAMSRKYLTAIESFDPDLLSELEAIAVAARVEVEDLLVLNARTSLLYNLPDDCTSIALVSTGNDRCDVLGQNWDNMARLRPVLLRVTPPGGPTAMTLTEAGTLAKIGFNEAGIGVCVNGLGRPGTPADGSIPLFIFLRRLLSTRSLDVALDLILSHHRDAPHNFLVASRDEGAVDIETLYTEAEVLPAESHGVVHTNHVLGDRLRRIDPREPSRNSVLRFQRASDILRSSGPRERTPERVLAVLSDHANKPDSICRHRSDSQKGFETITKHAVIMALRTGEMRIADGPPCSAPTDTFRLGEALASGEGLAARSGERRTKGTSA